MDRKEDNHMTSDLRKNALAPVITRLHLLLRRDFCRDVVLLYEKTNSNQSLVTGMGRKGSSSLS